MKKTMAGLGQVVLMKKGDYSWEIAKAPSVLTLYLLILQCHIISGNG